MTHAREGISAYAAMHPWRVGVGAFVLAGAVGVGGMAASGQLTERAFSQDSKIVAGVPAQIHGVYSAAEQRGFRYWAEAEQCAPDVAAAKEGRDFRPSYDRSVKAIGVACVLDTVSISKADFEDMKPGDQKVFSGPLGEPLDR